jgi:hypothetical protein
LKPIYLKGFRLQTQNPKNAIDAIAYIIPIEPNIGFLEYAAIICDTIPNPGIINI